MQNATLEFTPRSTQPCIPPGSLNRVPAAAGVRAGMSPLPGDPVWHVSSRSGVATLRTAIHLLLSYLPATYFASGDVRSVFSSGLLAFMLLI